MYSLTGVSWTRDPYCSQNARKQFVQFRLVSFKVFFVQIIPEKEHALQDWTFFYPGCLRTFPGRCHNQFDMLY